MYDLLSVNKSPPLLPFSLEYIHCCFEKGEKKKMKEMEMEKEGVRVSSEEQEQEQQYFGWQMKSPEIVEIGEDNSKNIINRNDVYVAVGKNDLHVVQWVLDHRVSPGTQLFLVHVFPPITYIPTPGYKKLILI